MKYAIVYYDLLEYTITHNSILMVRLLLRPFTVWSLPVQLNLNASRIKQMGTQRNP